jgi:autotransporter-associated beta strand protein
LTLEGFGTLVLGNGGNTYTGGNHDQRRRHARGGVGRRAGRDFRPAQFRRRHAPLRRLVQPFSHPPVELDEGGGTIDTNGFNTTIAGVIDGTGTADALTKAGAGTLTLSGINFYQGGTIIAGGTLAVAGDAALGASSGGVTFDGGTLRCLNIAFTTPRAVTLNAGSGTIDTAGRAW